MTIVVPVPIAPLPVAPYIGDPEFDVHADAHVAALTPHREQMNAIAEATYQNALDAHENAYDAEQQAKAAAKSEEMAGVFASTAAAAVDVTRWLSITQGGFYHAGDVVYSPINGQLYRRKGDDPGVGIGTDTDPSADPLSWWLIGAPLSAPIQQIAANTTAQPGMHYVITAALTLTLPSSPALRDIVQITDLSMSMAVMVDPGDKKISGATGQMKLNMPRVRVQLIYSGEEKGWI